MDFFPWVLLLWLTPQFSFIDLGHLTDSWSRDAQVEQLQLASFRECWAECTVHRKPKTTLYLALKSIETQQQHRKSALTIPSASYFTVSEFSIIDGAVWLKIDKIWTYLPQLQDADQRYFHWKRQVIDVSSRNQYVIMGKNVSNEILPISAPQSDASHRQNGSQQIIDLEVAPAPINAAKYGLRLTRTRQVQRAIVDTKQVDITIVLDNGRRIIRQCSMYLPAQATAVRATISHCFGLQESIRVAAPAIQKLTINDGERLLEGELAIETVDGQDLTTIRILNTKQALLTDDQSSYQMVETPDMIDEELLLVGYPGFLQPPVPSLTRIRVSFRGRIDSTNRHQDRDVEFVWVELEDMILPKLRGLSNSTAFMRKDGRLQPVGLISSGYTHLARSETLHADPTNLFLAEPTRILVLVPPETGKLVEHHASSTKIHTENYFLSEFDNLAEEVLVLKSAIDRYLAEHCEPDEYKQLSLQLNTIYAVGPKQQLLKVGVFNHQIVFIVGNRAQQIAYAYIVTPAFANQPASYEFIRVYGMQTMAHIE